MRRNHSKYFLSKKGVISFVFSKLAFLVFAVIITAVFFYVVTIEHNIQSIDKLAKISDGIGNTIDSASASGFKMWTIYKSNTNATINFQNQSFTILSNGKEIKHGLLFPIDATLSESNIPISCLNITNLNEVAIKKCQ